jgi:hypothetical protein
MFHDCVLPNDRKYLRKTVWICPECHTGWKITAKHHWKRLMYVVSWYMIWKATRGYPDI